MHILITRPEVSAASLSRVLQDLGHKVTIDPLIQILPIDSANVLKVFPLKYDIVVTTSQQAIRCLAKLLVDRSLPLWCVGSESAIVAKELGFKNVNEAEGSAKELVDKLTTSIDITQKQLVLHVSGDVIRVDLVEELSKRGISAQRVIVYETQEAKTLSEETKLSLKSGTLDVVLFYSPRTARVFQTLCKKANLDLRCAHLIAVCLSKAIATEIQMLPWKSIKVAKKTTTDDLLNAMMIPN